MKDKSKEYTSNEFFEKDGVSFWRTRIRASAIILDDDQRVLLIRQVDDLWGTPGGGVEAGESIEDGLRREIMEETGLEIELVRLIWFGDQISEEYRTLYIGATFLAKAIGGSIGSGEHDCQYYSRDELAQMNIFPKYLMDELWDAVEASKAHDPARFDK